MTLSTDLYVLDPVPMIEVFTEAIRQMGATNPVVVDRDAWGDNSTRLHMTQPGQGLPAWLTVHYRTDGPVLTDDQEKSEERSYCPAHFIRVNWDTTYGYRDKGENCGQLHARLVASLGQWLTTRRIRWAWRNEFTGEIFFSPSGLDRLGKS
jgi:hypothetical protein